MKIEDIYLMPAENARAISEKVTNDPLPIIKGVIVEKITEAVAIGAFALHHSIEHIPLSMHVELVQWLERAGYDASVIESFGERCIRVAWIPIDEDVFWQLAEDDARNPPAKSSTVSLKLIVNGEELELSHVSLDHCRVRNSDQAFDPCEAELVTTVDGVADRIKVFLPSGISEGTFVHVPYVRSYRCTCQGCGQ